MDRNKPQDSKNARMLAISACFDEFETRICKSVRSIVRSELDAALDRDRAETRQRKELVHQEKKSRGNLVDEQQREKARAALSGPPILPETKDGQGLIDIKALARFLDVSQRFLWQLASIGGLPAPVTLDGRSKRWLIEEILAWVFHGCAPGDKWRTIRTKAMHEYRTAFSARAS